MRGSACCTIRVRNMDSRAILHDNRHLSICARVVLLCAVTSLESHILFRKLPPVLQRHVEERMRSMALEERPLTLFDEEVVAQNPAPARVTNHWKWRATNPVMRRLRIPRFALECDLVWKAYPTRDLSRVDVSDIVYFLRAQAGVKNLIDFVAENGIEKLTGLIQTTMPRIS